jgi:hypothetical protein
MQVWIYDGLRFGYRDRDVVYIACLFKENCWALQGNHLQVQT